MSLIVHHRGAGALLFVALVSVAACGGSPESPAPGTPSVAANPPAPAAAPRPTTVQGYSEVSMPAGEWTEKMSDLEADLQNMFAAHRDAANDFAHDMEALSESSEIRPRRATLDALAKQLATVMPKASNGEVLRPRLAELLFVATRRAALPEPRLTQLQADVQKLLVTHGVADAAASSIAAQVLTVARESKRTA